MSSKAIDRSLTDPGLPIGFARDGGHPTTHAMAITAIEVSVVAAVMRGSACPRTHSSGSRA
jgi:hypothetical protein